MAKQKFTNVTINTNLVPSLAIQLRAAYGLKQMIETGTYYGDTAVMGALLFDSVLTCELVPETFPTAAPRLAQYPNVMYCAGDSAAWLRSRLFETEPASLFWLDAHWTGIGPRPEAGDSPILDELAAIRSLLGKHVVLVDDVRLFGSQGWPTLKELEKAAGLMGGYVQHIGDVLVVTPTPFAYKVPPT